jgi:DNA polymerase
MSHVITNELFADLETFSEIDLKRCGTHVYATKAEIMLFPYAIGEGEVKCWDLTAGAQMPDDLRAAYESDVLTIWQNGGMFDATIIAHAGPKQGIAPLPHSRIFDTMVCAFAHSLPGSLDKLCEVMGVAADKAKHKEGKALIQLFCKPRPKNTKLRRATRETHPEEWQRFIEYAKSDVSSMREVYRKIPRWNYRGGEYDLWLLDQQINSRGVAVDIALARGAVIAAERAKSVLASRAQVLTDGAIRATTQRDVLLEHLFEAYGFSLPDLQMDTIERRLNDPDLPDALRELLLNRLQASTTSVSKYNTLLRCTSADGRLRGLLQFDGAGRTGRWSGRMFQPQNLKRPDMKQEDIDFGIEVIKSNACEYFYDDIMRVVSNAVRGCIVAPEGRKLVVADLSNIEGRKAAWLAGEEWKLKYFRDFDAGLLEYDNYMMAYAKSFGVDPSVVMENKKHGDGTMRQIGKVQELMLQYQGRVGAFVTGAATYRIDLEALAVVVKRSASKEAWEQSAGFLKWAIGKKMPTFGLSDDAFIACDVLAMLWRDAHPAISSYWKELQSGFVDAVNHPGEWFTVRKLAFRKDGAWLRVRLPSGRFLCYPQPQVDDEGSCSYMGVNQYTRRWQRLSTYGGKLFENICQASSRDVMAYAMPEAEKQEYQVVLTVHDELITEAPDTDEFNVEGLSAILSTVPPWARGLPGVSGLPLAAAGFEGYRYRKD